jgi:hypothetical protein
MVSCLDIGSLLLGRTTLAQVVEKSAAYYAKHCQLETLKRLQSFYVKIPS